MSITTKTGDDGTTALFGGKRVSKDDPQIEAYGTIDETTSFIGLTHHLLDKKDQKLVTEIQQSLYEIMAFISGYSLNLSKLSKFTKSLEKNIYELEKILPPLTKFILPQGTETSSRLHVARAVARKSERKVVWFMNQMKKDKDKMLEPIKYLNRLSDLLFMLARKYNKEEKKTKKFDKRKSYFLPTSEA